MFNDIPYFKEQKIKSIRVDDSCYVITRYVNKYKTYEQRRNIVDSEIIEDEYFKTLSEYLTATNKDYRKKLEKVSNDKRDLWKHIVVLIVSVIGVIVPFIGMGARINSLIIFGGLTTLFGCVFGSYAYEKISKYVKGDKNKQFCEEYELLKKIYSEHLNKKRDIVSTRSNIQSIKPITNNTVLSCNKTLKKKIK